MPVTVDSAPLDTASLGLESIGDLLDHVQAGGRIAINITVDGQTPDMSDMAAFRALPADAAAIIIETADPREVALDALSGMENALTLTDELHQKAAALLQHNEIQQAMRCLGACLTTWQQAQQCITQCAALLKIDLDQVQADDQPLTEIINRFCEQLRDIRSALENQDYTTLSDILTYELSETGAAWRSAIAALSTDIAARLN